MWVLSEVLIGKRELVERVGHWESEVGAQSSKRNKYGGGGKRQKNVMMK